MTLQTLTSSSKQRAAPEGKEGLQLQHTTHHIQGGDAHDLALVIHTHGLQALGSNGDSGVDGVGDDV